MDPILYTAAAEGKVEMLASFDWSRLAVQLTATRNNALHIAAQSGHSGCVEEILRKCPSLLSMTNAKSETALHIAARKGSEDIVKVLIACAKQSNAGGRAEEITKQMLLRAKNEDQDTALHMAVRMPKARYLPATRESEVLEKKRGYLEVVGMLTEEDADFQHPPNNAKETPLYLAAEREYDEMVSLILRFSRNPAYTGPGRNALHAALLSKCTVDIINNLLDWKPELIKERDDCGWTPLHYAALKSSSEIVKLLLEKDKSIAYISTTDKDGDNKTAIHIAAYRGRVDVMQQLLLYCPDCWEILTSNKGQNIFHLAMESAETSVIKFILGNPLMEHLINQKDVEGNTPLHLFAAWHDGRRLLRLEENQKWKLDFKGDWNAFNNQNLSPQDVAEINKGHYSIYPSLRNIVSSEKDYITRRKKYLHDKIDATIGDLRKEKIEGFRKVGESHLIVAALIATVTFAAGFTLPGGYDGNQGKGQGLAVLAKVVAFKLFVISNTIAVTCSTSAVFLYAIAALYDYVIISSEGKPKMGHRHDAAVALILIAMGAMTVAFITGAYAVLAHSLGLAFLVCAIASPSLLLYIFEIWKFMDQLGGDFLQ